MRSRTTPVPLLKARIAANNSRFFVKRGAKAKSPGSKRTDTRKAMESIRSLPETILFREIPDAFRR